FLFTDSDFSRIRTLIHRRAGIALGEQKRQMVYSRLSRRLRELQVPDFATYLDWLEGRQDGEEWQLFINSLTTNLTSFFREAHHFPTLAEHVRKAKQPVTVWCAAASTGEEPYSIAITLMEALGDKAGSSRVIATDIDIRQQGTVDPHSKGNVKGFQAGTDLWADANWRAGVYVGQLDGDMSVTGFARGIVNYAAGSNDLRSQYLGAYATWKNDSGLYVDGVLQAGRHRYTVSPTLSFGSSGKGISLLASIEVGQAFSIAPGWTIEPQLQLVHQRVSLDDGSIAGALVQQDSHNGWLARAGVRVKGEIATSAGLLQPYARLNLYSASAGTDVAQFINAAAVTRIASATAYRSAELAGGFTLSLSQATSVYGEIGRLYAMGGDTRAKSALQGSVGVRARW
ncbi:autotransporter domain-containing protein, partial [Variovorax sp. RHLX14]|uniref:autotransporter domain-containing protein n=1 Tax=Variovorax sp. RHLX14 TaxID=1259731 RepID=UPI003F4615BE